MSDRLDLLVVDEAELERKNASASIIQRAFRMYESRKLGKEMREGRGRDHALSELRESIAARKVQRWIRRSLGGRWDTHRRNKNREILASERHQAAIRIQSGARRWLAQRLFKRRKYYVQNSGCAAVAVQLWWRKILAKRKLIDLKRRHEEAKAAAAERERRELAATLIQSHWRTRKAERQTREERMRAKKFRRKQEEARRLSAACNIQTWWRWLKARAELQRLKEAQAIREARLREHQRKMDAATKLQSFGRMIIVRRAAEPLLTTARVNAARRIREKCTEYQAASKIQRAYRYHYAKRLLKRLREERRKALYEARCSVLVANVQRIGRGFCVRRDLGNVLREMAMEALEYHRRQEALEMADRAQEAAPTDEGIQVPVMAEGELCPAVEATEQQHFRMTQDERDTRPMLCPMPPGDVHHAVHTPSTEREVVQEQDVEESETDEEISDKRPSSAICRSVSKMLEEERQKRLREPEGEHVEAEREAPRVESLARSPSKMDDQEEERLSVPVELHEETIEEQQSFSQHKETEAFPAESTEEKETPEPCEDNDEVRAETRRLTVLRNAVAINDELEELERLYELEDAEEERDESRRLSALENAIAINDESQELKRLREVVEEEEEADNQLEAQALVTVSSSEEVPTVQRTLPPTDQKPLKTEELDQQQVLPEEPEPIGALEAALAVERKKRQESMAEEKRLRLARDALRAKANEYRLRQIAAAEKKEELQALIPRLPLERRRRELEMQTPENRPPRSSASLRELQLRRTMNAAIEKDRAALNITRVARGYLDRQYSQVLRRLTTEYIEYRVEMDLEEPPALDRELLQKFSEMHQEGVEKARGVRCVTAVQAFLRARESRKLTTHRAARVLPPLQTFLSAPPSLHDHAVVLCRFARVVLAKREVAARQQAVLACLQETRRMEALSTLRGFLHIVRAKQERAALRRVADASLQQEEAADALLNQAACKIAKFWRVMTAKIALQNRKKAVEERLRSGGAAEKVTVFLRLCCAKQELTRRKSQAKQQREVDIALETALDDAAMRVQRAYRTYKARQLAKQQRDAKQEHWKSIQAQDEEITAAMAAIAADATDQAEPWVNLEFYEMMQAEEEGEEEEDDDWEAEEFLYCIIAAQKFVRGLLARRKVRALREQLQQADKERQQREKEEGAKEEETKDPEPSCSGGEDPDHVAEL
ncbi:hypothetical protein DQ04_03181000 [Trypanosoma grayi]|uniref:hypothetical protein n=1 Tax=Trypanosoma grayi TaxID=71804 RepID=UPI0004F44832|nr:hypothetical protein DQ04_03181000 [Trypanosoma grayi]KEG10887.1 hypothetical protein DQ04_03181000 [Trypanosoma grayi]